MMSLTQAIIAAVLFIAGIIIGSVWTSVRNKRKIPWAGELEYDMRRETTDAIRISSPYNMAHWYKYKQIRFTVIPLFEQHATRL